MTLPLKWRRRENFTILRMSRHILSIMDEEDKSITKGNRMNKKRKTEQNKFTVMLRAWIVARDTDGNVVIGREVIEGIRDSGRTKRCLVIEGLPPQGVVGNN